MTRQVALLDDVAAWLCAMVITAYVESGSKQALRILCKWIRVAYHLKELRSFNMFFAAMFGIQSLDTYETDEGTLLLDLIGELGEATGADAESAEVLLCVTAKRTISSSPLCPPLATGCNSVEKIGLAHCCEMLMLMLALTNCYVRFASWRIVTVTTMT